jgi:hypothetical protein
MRKSAIVGLFFLLPLWFFGQSHNYWRRSFNEESSLLSGAVVGGGSGPSAIYFNPASISEVVVSKLSLNASLFSFDIYDTKNAFGEGLNLFKFNANIEPRFISYMFKLQKKKKWSFEIAILNNENDKLEVTSSVDVKNDVLSNIPGEDRYFAFYQYTSHFKDQWIGIGTSVQLNERLIVGTSMFVSIKSLNYTNSLNITAYPLNDTLPDQPVRKSFFVAGYEDFSYLKFNDYRLLWKIGVLYKWNRVNIGLSITTPSVGVYSDGKRDERKQQQYNISDPTTGAPIPDYLIIDYQEKSDVDVSFKTPFSIAAGMTYYLPDNKRTLYLSMEYFAGIETYKIVQANESDLLGMDDSPYYSDWLTYITGARPVFNVAVGYSWTLSEKLMLKAGLRSDFNYEKNLDLGELEGNSTIHKNNLDLYYLTCGLSWKLFGQDIITGLQYSIGIEANQKQIVNLSDPVEYNYIEEKPLQGTRLNNSTVLYNSIVVYLGFSVNFKGKE